MYADAKFALVILDADEDPPARAPFTAKAPVGETFEAVDDRGPQEFQCDESFWGCTSSTFRRLPKIVILRPSGKGWASEANRFAEWLIQTPGAPRRVFSSTAEEALRAQPLGPSALLADLYEDQQRRLNIAISDWERRVREARAAINKPVRELPQTSVRELPQKSGRELTHAAADDIRARAMIDAGVHVSAIFDLSEELKLPEWLSHVLQNSRHSAIVPIVIASSWHRWPSAARDQIDWVFAPAAWCGQELKSRLAPFGVRLAPGDIQKVPRSRAGAPELSGVGWFALRCRDRVAFIRPTAILPIETASIHCSLDCAIEEPTNSADGHMGLAGKSPPVDPSQEQGVENSHASPRASADNLKAASRAPLQSTVQADSSFSQEDSKSRVQSTEPADSCFGGQGGSQPRPDVQVVDSLRHSNKEAESTESSFRAKHFDTHSGPSSLNSTGPSGLNSNDGMKAPADCSADLALNPRRFDSKETKTASRWTAPPATWRILQPSHPLSVRAFFRSLC